MQQKNESKITREESMLLGWATEDFRVREEWEDEDFDPFREDDPEEDEMSLLTEELYGAPDIDGCGGVYRSGCHTYNLHDQEGDSTNTTESGGLYDEAFGPRDPKRHIEES